MTSVLQRAVIGLVFATATPLPAQSGHAAVDSAAQARAACRDASKTANPRDALTMLLRAAPRPRMRTGVCSRQRSRSWPAGLRIRSPTRRCLPKGSTPIGAAARGTWPASVGEPLSKCVRTVACATCTSSGTRVSGPSSTCASLRIVAFCTRRRQAYRKCGDMLAAIQRSPPCCVFALPMVAWTRAGMCHRTVWRTCSVTWRSRATVRCTPPTHVYRSCIGSRGAHERSSRYGIRSFGRCRASHLFRVLHA